MTKEQTKKTGGSFNNLKRIHELQNSGKIQSLLRDLRSTRTQIDHVFTQIKDCKKQLVISSQEAAKKAAAEKVVEETKIEANVVANKVEEVFVEPAVEEKVAKEEPKTTSNQERREYPNNNRQFNSNNRGEYQQRQYNNQNGRPYNNNQRQFNNQDNRGNFQRNNGQQRPFGANGGKPGFNQNRPFNQNNGQNSGNGRPFNQNNGGAQRPFGQRPFGTKSPSFASSKANNYKSFAEEDSKVLAQPERNFGNKNKSAVRDIDERKQVTAKKSNVRKNVFINDSDGYEETVMGSRKLIKSKKEKTQTFVAPTIDHAVITSENITVKVLSEKTGKPVNEIIKQLMLLGVMATINSVVDFETCELVASELGVTLELKVEKTFEEKMKEVVNQTDSDEEVVERPPIVAVMGHVDHGKTSLLDAIRQTNMVGGEAGGITQKIGAYTIKKNDKHITFIDTPGHAAFTAMRARGANATDIAILVVAADDGIMPQTIEAIDHIKAANVPMIVAINKIDKVDADVNRIKQQLTEHGIVPEEWGGDAILVPISAKFGKGIDELISMILLVAEMQELKANPSKMAKGVVIEAELDKNKGPLASILVQNGTLRIGDNVICGLTYGKVKAMYDENGKTLKEAGPSIPVKILGLNEVPSAGDNIVAIDEKLSKQVIEERKNKIKSDRQNVTSGVSLDDFMTKVNEGKLKTLNIIIKADVQGSVEALQQTLTAIKNEEVRVLSIHRGVGPITETDVVLAQASQAIIIAFNVKTSPKAQQMAKNAGVEIKNYSVIYEVVDDITAAINGMLTVKYEKKVIGHGEVRMVFKLSNAGYVAGSYITDGKVTRDAHVRLLRDGEELQDTVVQELKILKDNKAEVNHGYECGIKLRDCDIAKIGDTLEFYINEPIKRG